MRKPDFDQWIPPEKVRFIPGLFREGAALARSRILLQRLGVSPKVPLGGKDAANVILNYFFHAQEGYILTRGNQNTRQSLMELDLFRQHQPLSVHDLQAELAELGFSWGPSLAETPPSESLVAFSQSAITIACLQASGSATFADFPLDIDGLDLGGDELETSFWSTSANQEHLWHTIAYLEASMKSVLYKEDPISPVEYLSVGHFFAAGAHLAEQLQI